jgi:hypothetical protein
MMRADAFFRSVGFAAAAAVGSVAWLVCTAPVLGGRRALDLWLVGLTAAYVGGLAGGVRRRVAAAVVTAGAGLGAVALAPGTRELALALAAMLGIGRTACVPRSTPLRAVATEAGLVVGGLAFAAVLGGPSLRGVALGVWGFFLVQSFLFLIPTGGVRTRVAGGIDPFDAAHARAVALLDYGPRFASSSAHRA